MYSTCLFCHSALGTNESIEHFPIGKRLAFDAAKGRLWVVCRKCQRWNLSPIEERWEAIEESERAYRDTKKRVTTDQVGLARLRDGTDLIRIGEPLRPEFAAWRYGDTFGRRRRKNMLLGATAAVGGGALIVGAGMGSFAVGGSILAFSIAPQIAIRAWFRWMERSTRLTIADQNGELVPISPFGLKTVSINFQRPAADEPLQIGLMISDIDRSKPLPPSRLNLLSGLTPSFGYRAITLSGPAAERALARLLIAKSGVAGSAREVTAAVTLVENASTPSDLLRNLPDSLKYATKGPFETHSKRLGHLSLTGLAPHARLALEMSLHEESERRALEGELHELEQRWKEAEEIAAISDSMFLTPKSGLASD